MSLSEKLIRAAKNGSSREVRKLLGRGVQITKDKFGNTALHEAAWNGHNDIVKALLNAFCFVDSINNNGFTPLHLASQNGHGKAVKTLLKWRADPTLRNQHGETALHLAAKYNHSTVISVFASFKINVDIVGKDGNTALHIAAKLGNTEAIKALLSAGANPSIMNVRGARPMNYAEIGGFKSAIKLLSSQKLKVRPRSLSEHRGQSKSPPQREASKLQTQTSTSSQAASPQSTGTPRRLRASSTGTRLNFRLTPNGGKKKTALPSDLSLTQESLPSQAPSPPNPYEELDKLDEDRLGTAPPKAPTIDQLLSEIEKEYLGPDYEYHPQEDTPAERAWVGPNGMCTGSSGSGAKTFLKSTHTQNPSQDRTSPHPPLLKDPYDYLLPPEEIRAIETAFMQTFQAYETIPPKASGDDDTYVYMAPCRDLQSDSPQPSNGSPDNCSPNTDPKFKIPKRAIICSSPVVPDERHEPNSRLEPAKGILSQPSSIQQSQLDKYLQDELETMRQAFQIRLSQLEKRYQRQLMIEQQKNSTNPGILMPINVQLRARRKRVNSQQRRSSWHSCVSDSETEESTEHIPRCGSSQGFDSDCTLDDSDVELTPVDQSDDEAMYRSHDPYSDLGVGFTEGQGVMSSRHLDMMSGDHTNGLMGGMRTWEEETGNGAQASPRLPVVQDSVVQEDGSLSPSAKSLIQQRVTEQRAKILHYFQQVSEAKIAAIERQYEAQMSEVEKRCQSQATEKMSVLETRVKDLEKMLDVETLV